MTSLRRSCLAACLLPLVFTGALAAETPLGKFTLAPGEKRAVTVESAARFKAGFTNELPLEQIKTCKKTCIQISVTGDPFSVTAAAVGTTIVVNPKGGKAEIVFENLEAFPIPIRVFMD